MITEPPACRAILGAWKAAGMSRPGAAELVRQMAGRHRMPDALRRADTLARHGRPA